MCESQEIWCITCVTIWPSARYLVRSNTVSGLFGFVFMSLCVDCVRLRGTRCKNHKFGAPAPNLCALPPGSQSQTQPHTNVVMVMVVGASRHRARRSQNIILSVVSKLMLWRTSHRPGPSFSMEKYMETSVFRRLLENHRLGTLQNIVLSVF